MIFAICTQSTCDVNVMHTILMHLLTISRLIACMRLYMQVLQHHDDVHISCARHDCMHTRMAVSRGIR